MTEVTLRTLKGTAFSADNKDAGRSFDLRSWQGLTEVLKAGREGLDPVAYAEFRDLVLAYAQSGGTSELKRKIDAILLRLGGGEVTKSTKPIVQRDFDEDTNEKQREDHTVENNATPILATSDTANVSAGERKAVFGTRRNSPVFRSTSKIIPTTYEVVGDNKKETTPAKKENLPTPPSRSEEVAAVVALPDTHTISPESSKKVEIKSVESEMGSQESIDAYKLRIAEIKRAVHARYENPVVLMGAGNAVGKEYMSALLEAVKASGGGQTEVLGEAMTRLETAHLALLAKQPQIEARTTEKKAEVGDVLRQEAGQSVPAKKEVFQASIKVEEPKPVVQHPAPAQDATDRDQQFVDLKSIPSLREVLSKSHPTVDPEVKSAVSVVPHGESRETKEIETLASGQKIMHRPKVSGVQEETKKKIPFQTQAEDEKLVEPILAPTSRSQNSESPKVTTTKHTELAESYSKEVNEALIKLLAEWPLFRSSGIFATGPGGMDHPLYLELKGLPMSSVLSGRWNNADPETIKSLKDYVNAWRHEQGVAYTVNETFEQYLRRVIVKILKRQS